MLMAKVCCMQKGVIEITTDIIANKDMVQGGSHVSIGFEDSGVVWTSSCQCELPLFVVLQADVQFELAKVMFVFFLEGVAIK